MTRSTYDQVFDGDWWRFGDGKSNRRMKIACCDCGLVHQHRIRVLKGILYMQINRMPRETGGRRRALRQEKENGDD